MAWPVVAIFAFLVAILVEITSSATCPSGLETLSIQLPKASSPEFAGFVVPRSNVAGTPKYSDECLNVQIRQGGPHIDPLEELALGNADIVLAEGAQVARSISDGEAVLPGVYELANGDQFTISDLTLTTSKGSNVGNTFTISDVTDNSFSVSGYGGGSATYTASSITFQNGSVATKFGALSVIAGYYQDSALALVALQSLASNMQDFLFKSIGLRTPGNDLSVEAMFVQANIDPKSMTYAQQTPYLSQLESGMLDFATVLLNDDLGYILRWLDSKTNFLRQAANLTIFKTADYSAPALHHVAVVKASSLPTIREKLVKFLRVVSKTWLYCRDNEASCISAFPYSGPFQHWQMREANRLVFPSPDGLGVISSQKWQAMSSPLVSSNLISNLPLAVDNSLLAEANDFTGSSDAASAYTAASLDFCAPYGSSVPLEICTGSQFMLCPAGHEPPSSSGACVACPAGKFFFNSVSSGGTRMNVCETCPAGKYSSGAGASKCAHCGPGTYRSEPMQPSLCEQCAAGKVAAANGMTACDDCTRGRFAATESSSECQRCPDGKYTSARGSISCVTCPANTSTLGAGAIYAHECACPPHMYRKSNGDCATCPVGFTCPEGSDEGVLREFANPGFTGPSGEYPQLLPGYWASKAEPLSVYICHDLDQCPGGPPESCAPNMVDVACGTCAEGYFRQGQVCERCTPTDETAFNYPTVPVFLGLAMVIVLYNIMQDTIEYWEHWTNELWSLAYLTLVHYQIIGLVVGCNVPWPTKIKGTLYAWEYFVDVSDMLRLSCVGNGTFRAFQDAYLVRWTAPLFLLACFVIVWTCGLLLAELGIAVRNSKGRWLDACFRSLGMRRFNSKIPPKLAVYPSALINCYLAVIFAFYISLSFVALIPFMCYESPNGKSLLRFGPTIQCDTTDSDSILAEAVIGLIVYIGFFIAGLGYVTVIAPINFGSKGFRAMWKFLFIKFRPDVWWWGIVLLIRALLLCLTQVFSQEGERHLIWMMVVTLLYTGMLVFLRPWRSIWANVLDIWIQAAIFLFMSFGATFVARSDWLDDSVAHFAIVITFVPLVAIVLTAVWVIACGVPVVKENLEEVPNRKLSDDIQAAFAKFVGLDKNAAQTFVKKLSETDRRVLLRAWFIVAAELVTVGQRPSWVKQSPGHLVRPLKEPKEEVEEEIDDMDVIDVNDKEGYVPKWKQNPPNRRSPKPASQGSKDTEKMKEKEETARTNTTAAASQGGVTQSASTSRSTGAINISEPTDVNAIRAQIA